MLGGYVVHLTPYDDINFTYTYLPVPLQDFVALSPKIAGGFSFAPIADGTIGGCTRLFLLLKQRP